MGRGGETAEDLRVPGGRPSSPPVHPGRPRAPRLHPLGVSSGQSLGGEDLQVSSGEVLTHVNQPPGQVTPRSRVGATRCPWPDLVRCSSPAPPRGTRGPHPLCLPRKQGMDECTASVERKMDRDRKPTVGRGHPLGLGSPTPLRSPQASSRDTAHTCVSTILTRCRGHLGEAAPSGSTHWSQDPRGRQNPRTLKSLLYNDTAFARDGSLKWL